MKSKSLLISLLCFGIALLLLVAAAPALLSTRFVQTHYLIPMLEKSSKGSVSLEHATFSWLGGQRVKAFNWSDTESSLSFDDFQTDIPLYRLLWKDWLSGNATLENVTLRLPDDVSFTGFNGNMTLENGVAAFALEGDSLQKGQAGKMKFRGTLPVGEHFSQGSLTVHLIDFPSRFLQMPVTPAHIPLYLFVGDQLNGTLEYQEGSFHVVAATNQGNADLTFSLENGGLAFTEEGKLSYQLPQEAAAELKKASLPTLHSPMTVRFLKGDRPSIAVRIDSVNLSPGVNLSQLKGSIDFDRDLSSLSLFCEGMVKEKGGESPVALNGSIRLLPEMSYDLDIEAKEFKTELISPFFQDPDDSVVTLAKTVFGPKADTKLHLSCKDNEELIFLSVKAKSAEIPGILFRRDSESVTLVEPSHAYVVLSPSDWIMDSSLPKQLPLTVQLNAFEMKLNEIIHPQDIALSANISMKEMSLDQLPLVKSASFSNGLLTVDGSLDALKGNFVGRVNHLQKGTWLSSIMDPEMRFTASGLFGFNQDWDLAIKSVSLNCDDPTLQFAFEGKQTGGSPFTLDIEGRATYTLLPHKLSEISSGETTYYQLISPVTTHFIMDKARVNTRHLNLKNCDFQGAIVIDHIVAGENRSQAIASIHNIEIPLTFKNGGEELTFYLDATSQNEKGEDKGRIVAKGEIKDLLKNGTVDFDASRVDAKVQLMQFPVAILEALLAKDGLDEMIGFTLDGDLNISSEKGSNEGRAHFFFESEALSLSGAVKTENALQFKTLGSPIAIAWKITPERFREFRHFILGQNSPLLDSLTLSRPARIHAELSDLSLSLHRFSASAGSLSIAADDLAVNDRMSGDTVTLNRLTANLTSENIGKRISLNFVTSGHIFQRESETFELSLDAAISHLFSSSGDWQPSKATIEADGRAAKAPVLILSDIFALDPSVIRQIDGLIGERLDASLTCRITELTGPVKLAAAGPIGKFSLEGGLKRGLLTLATPLAAEIKITPKLSTSILDEIVPFLRSAVSSETLVKLAISPEGFYYPLWTDAPYDFAIGSMRIDLGIVTFKNTLQIADILTLLKYTDGGPYINVWFTPIYLSYSNQLVTLQRLDMLVAGRYPLAVWGKVNFAEDKMSMKIGLGGMTLRRAFGLKGVPKNYYLQVPLKGSPSNPNLDVGGAATKIAGLMAQLRGGPQGVLVGGLMDLLGTTMGQKPTPPPTTSPFPWEKEGTGL